MKKKILALCLILALAVTAIGGATLAYFQDTDAQTNVFTIGNVKIDLFEDFNTDNITLVPAVGTLDPDTGYAEFKNTVEKEVYIENEGSEEAYVRVHIAVPAFEREGEAFNVFNLMYDEYSTVDGKWIWGTNSDSNYPIRDGGEWNMYRNVEIQGVPYKVYVLTYETALERGNITVDAINKVYMNPEVTNEEITAWNAQYADEYGSPVWNRIYVVAEAVQADGWDDAVVALNEAFGDPATAEGQLGEADFLAAPENDQFVEREAMNGD